MAHLLDLRTAESNFRIPLVAQLPKMPIKCHKNSQQKD